MGRRVGAPPVEINWQALDAMLQFKPTLKFCAEFLKCSEDTVEKRIRENFDMTFSEYREMKMQNVVLKLKQKAVVLALEGNVPMIKFVLSNMSDWREKVESNINSSSDRVSIQIVKDENQAPQ